MGERRAETGRGEARLLRHDDLKVTTIRSRHLPLPRRRHVPPQLPRQCSHGMQRRSLLVPRTPRAARRQQPPRCLQARPQVRHESWVGRRRRCRCAVVARGGMRRYNRRLDRDTGGPMRGWVRWRRLLLQLLLLLRHQRSCGQCQSWSLWGRCCGLESLSRLRQSLRLEAMVLAVHRRLHELWKCIWLWHHDAHCHWHSGRFAA